MSSDTLLREVDEELRGDRLRALWRRFGPYIIGGAVAVVLLVAINEGWSWWQQSNAARSSDEFYAALEAAERGDIEAARTALDTIATQGSGGYRTLAQFRKAGLLAREGKRDEAVAAYDAIATAESNPRLRELALVLAAYNLVDGGDVAAVTQRVGALAVEGNPLRNAAREAIGLTQYKAGELLAALTTFGLILSDPQVDADMRGRVQIYLAQLTAMGAVPRETAETGAADAGAAAAAPAGGSAPAPETSLGGAPELDVIQPEPDATEPVPEVPQASAAPAETPPAEAPAAATPAQAPAAAAPAAKAPAASEPVPEVPAN